MSEWYYYCCYCFFTLGYPPHFTISMGPWQSSAEICLITACLGVARDFSILLLLCCLYMPFQEESVAINIDVLQHRSAYSHYLSRACVLSSSLNGLEETTTQRNWYPPGEFLPGGARRGSVGNPSTGCHANPKQQLRAGGCGSHEWSPVPLFLEFTSILMPQPKIWFRRETPPMTFLPRVSVAELQPKENKY